MEREAQTTLPRALREALTGASAGPLSLAELSEQLGVSQKELPAALDKLRRTLERAGQRLRMQPSCCLACQLELSERTRAKRPSRCPRCASERLTHPRFWIE